MKHLLSILILLALLTAGATATVMQGRNAYGVRGTAPATDLTADLWHFWNPSVNGTNDMGSKPQNVTLNGGLASSTNGWDMAGDNAYYAAMFGPISNGIDYTVSAWIKPAKSAMDVNGSGGWIISDRTATAGKDDFQFYYDRPTAKIIFGVLNSAGTYVSVSTTNATLEAVWRNVACVVNKSSSTLTMYDNGILQQSVALNITPNNGSVSNSAIGTISWGLGDNNTKYHGTLDKIRFYGTAKNAAFIQAIYNAEKASKGL